MSSRTSDRHYSSIGAMITVFALAIDPFAQQITSYRTRDLAAGTNSTVAVGYIYSNTNTPSISAMQQAFFTGLYGLDPMNIQRTCLTGNCTWSPYQTLAVCSRCVNVTDQVKMPSSRSCNPNFAIKHCGWSLPIGLKLDPGFDSNFSGKFLSQYVYGIPIANISILSHAAEPSGPIIPNAAECNLYWCINTYVGTVTTFRFHEQLLASVPNRSDPASPSDTLKEPYFWTRPDPLNNNHSFFEANASTRLLSPDNRYSKGS